MNDFSRTWAEVSIDAIIHNYREMRARIGNAKFLGVVKANSYGHGAKQVATALSEEGCDYFAVACLSEAIQLRTDGVTKPILILGVTGPEDTELLIKYDITQSVGNLALAKAFSAEAVRLGKTLKAHFKLDTGMGRLGFTAHGEAEADMVEALKLPGISYEGVFTHFAVSDTDGGEEYTNAQLDTFISTIDALERASGIKFEIRHCTNSGAMVNYKKAYLDMVRPGIVLYGCYPGSGLDLIPAMSLKTRIVQIKDFEENRSVSYGRTYTTDKPRRIAVIPVGYADGLHRCLSNKMNVIIRGKLCPQVGMICMDMCMIDVSGLPDAAVGDTVTVFGFGDGLESSVDELAEKAGTISYELLCAVSPRIPRIYIRNGEMFDAEGNKIR